LQCTVGQGRAGQGSISRNSCSSRAAVEGGRESAIREEPWKGRNEECYQQCRVLEGDGIGRTVASVVWCGMAWYGVWCDIMGGKVSQLH
jgi:hypothetical protein